MNRFISAGAFAAAAISTALAIHPAKAADEKGLYQTLYFISCASYTEDRKQPVGTGNNAVDQIYVSGWLTSYNYMTPNTYNIVSDGDITKVMAWLDKFCADNPKKNIEGALLQLSGDLYPDRVQHYTPPPADAAKDKKK